MNSFAIAFHQINMRLYLAENENPRLRGGLQTPKNIAEGETELI